MVETTTLTLLVRSRNSAVSGRVAVALMQMGFHISAQQYTSVDDGVEARLRLVLNGKAADHAKLIETISEIQDVVRIETTGEDPKIPSSDEIDRQIVIAVGKLLTAEFPDSLPPLRDFAADLDDRLRAPILFAVGEQVGLSIGANQHFSPTDTLDQRLAGAFTRTMKPFASVYAQKRHFSVTPCPMETSQVAKYCGGCSFMTGLSKGILEAPPDAPNVKVTRTLCHAEQDRTCRFEVIGTDPN